MYDYNDLFNGLGSGYSSSSDWTGVFAAFAGFMIFLVLIVLAVAVFMIIATWILFKKCGKPGWAAIIPYYNTWVNNEIAGCHWIVFAAMILPTVASLLLNVTGVGSVVLSLISVFAGVCASYNLALKFKKGAGFCVGLVLLPVVFIPILAFSKNAVYDKDVKVKNCAFFDVNF